LVNPGIANMRVCEGHQLLIVGGICQNFLVTGH
jgi:hypothetical protein